MKEKVEIQKKKTILRKQLFDVLMLMIDKFPTSTDSLSSHNLLTIQTSHFNYFILTYFLFGTLHFLA